jgi:hypothetical protein
MDAIEIYAVADGLGHGDALFQSMLLEPLHLLGMDLYLSSDHFILLATDAHRILFHHGGTENTEVFLFLSNRETTIG